LEQAAKGGTVEALPAATMRPEETCPTCGTKLGPLHQREALRRCDACRRLNPRGFRYCGFCAAPIETVAEQAERADVAAPPGGWPNLARELVEMRFFLDRGELDEAYELLSILHQRHPGHPALVEFIREPAARRPRPDTHVFQVVDAVLADSSSLGASSLPRRSVPQWNAPVTDDGEESKKTRSHAAVSLGSDDEEPTSRRPRPRALEPEPPKRPARARTDKHLGAVPVAKSEATAKRSRSGATKALGAEGDEPKGASKKIFEPPKKIFEPPKKAARADDLEGVPKKVVRAAGGHTVAVPTLQPPKPFEGATPAEGDEGEDARPTRIMSADKALRSSRAAKKAAVVEEPAAEPRAAKKPERGAVRKRMLEPELAAPAKAIEPRKRSSKHTAAQPPDEPEAGKKRTRPVSRFGQNVLGRFGKGKP
jgi:hypothetical protein